MESKFITLEGIEGSGKSTNIETINKILDQESIEYINTIEPGASSIGKNIRNILLDRETNISTEAELLLMLADRKDHIEKVIVPALRSKKWVISDRFMDSTYAYQGGGRRYSIEKINRLAELLENEISTAFCSNNFFSWDFDDSKCVCC